VPRIPPILAQAVLVAAVAVGTYWGWLSLTRAQVLSPGAVIVCTAVTTLAVWAMEAVVRHARRGRPRRAHARPTKPKGVVR
jgi:hypothetical protein